MSTNKKHNVSEKELDNLLGQAFLNLDFNNPKNQELMEAISNNAMLTPNVSSVFFIKKYFATLINIVTITAISIILFFLFFNNEQTSKFVATKSLTTHFETTKPSFEKTVEEPKATKNNSNDKVALQQESIITNSTIAVEKQLPPLNDTPNYHQQSIFPLDNETKIKSEDTNYVFPKLTEKEIKQNNRQKKIMWMLLVKPSKYWYPLIGDANQNKYAYGKITDTSSVFYMARAEVTNLEYRTFLFDLLIHGEKEAFLIAKPHQELWLTAPGHAKGKDMKDNYFFNNKYNDYPVVNITVEGAEMYCKWLGNTGNEPCSKVIARLPYENEWIKAAKGKNTNAIYPWPGDSIQNKFGCFLGNFCIKKQSEKLRTVTKCIPKNVNAFTSAEFMLGDSVMPAKVYSYNPNDYGLHCMSGNVAEMVYDNKTKSVITKGGSWNSDFEQCKLSNKEELNDAIKANSMTGFRPVFRIN